MRTAFWSRPPRWLAETEVALGAVDVALLAQLAEDLGEVVGDHAEVVGVGGVRRLLELPAGNVGMDAVVERRVHLLRQRMEEVRGPHDGFDVAVDVADEDDRSLCGDDIPAAAEGAVLHVALHDVQAALVREPDPGRLVERDDVPETDQPPLPRREIDEHLRRRRLPAGYQMAVRAELLVDEALSCTARTQFHRVEILLDERHEAQHVVQLAPPGVVGVLRFVTQGSHQQVEPLIAREAAASCHEVVELPRRELDGADALDEERPVLGPEDVGVVVAQRDLGPDSAQQQAVVLSHLALFDVDVVEVEVGEPRPVLVVGLDQAHGDLVDDLERGVLLDGRLDRFALVRLDVLARQRLADEFETLQLMASSSVEAQYLPSRNSMTNAGTPNALRMRRNRSLRTTRPG